MSTNDGYEMLKALYDFEATLPKTLSFTEGDHFILQQDNIENRNWWQSININGQIGFVPSNYVTNIQVEPQFMVNFLEECVGHLKDNPSQEKQQLLAELVERKLQIEASLKPGTKKQAPKPPSSCNDLPVRNGKVHIIKESDHTSPQRVKQSNDVKPNQSNMNENNHDRLHNSQSVSEKLATGEESGRSKSRSPHRSQSSPSMKSPAHSEEILTHALYTMVERVRRDTQLSHDLSRVSVSTILDCLKELVSNESCGTVWSMASLASAPGPLPAGRALLRSSADARRLRAAFGGLTSCARDAQQRAWALHDDNHFIIQQLQEVINILPNADIRVSKDILSTEQYEYVNILVLFYQMETRWNIRQLLIKAFEVMCGLEHEIIKILGGSVLPREIARDILDNQTDYPRLIASSKILTAILSLGDPLPISHFEQLDMYFVTFLLELIESPPETDEGAKIQESFMTLVLAFNLQFNDTENNLVLDALQSRNDGKVFTEKLLLLINREDDPVHVFEHESSAPHSVLKLSLDAFSRRPTASLFYTNDTKVLLDIIVRQLADLSAGDSRRGLYLKLCLGILRHTDYSHCHRQADLLRCFTRIFCEEGEQSTADQALTRTISNEFPQYFKS